MNFEPLKLTIRNDNFKGDEKRDYDDRYDKRPYDDMPSYSGPKDYPKRTGDFHDIKSFLFCLHQLRILLNIVSGSL